MANVRERENHLVRKLRDRGYRLTPQRLALVGLIAASEGHPSAAQLHARIRRRFSTMSPATVYKLLALLKEQGEVLEIDLRDESRYDGNRPDPHPHLVCTMCGRIVDASMDLEPGWLRDIETRSGYRIDRHTLTLFGACPECRT